MRPQRLLRASSTQNVCAFCACRLTGQAPPTAATTPLALQQRTFSNSRRQDNSSPPWSGFDPNSSLSLSEQKEKAARIARRQEAEAAQAAAEAAERQRRAEEKRRQDEALAARKQEMQKARAGQWPAQSGRQQQTHRRQGGGQNGARGDSVVRKHNVRGGDVFAQTNSHQRQQHNARDRPGSLPRPSRLSKEKEMPAPSEPLPSFMRAPSTSEPEKKQPQGWGVGRVERKSLEYGEFEAELEPDEPAPAKSAFGNQKEDSVNTRSELAPEPQQRPTPGFGFGRRADFKPRPTQPAQSNDEFIHDIFGSGREPEPQTSPTTYRPAFQGEAQSEAQPSRMRSQPFSRDQSRFNPAQDESTEYDNWQHLGQRQSRVPQPQAEQNQSSPFDDESWIDRSFAEHREARDSRFRSARANPTLQSAARRRGQRENDVDHESVRRTPTCGRCGQQGHIARECSSPVTAKCHFCGQIGHMASRCPSSDRAQQSRDSRGSETSYSDPRRQMLERMRPSRNEETSGRENAFEERAERAIKSRKFRDDEPRKEKGSRRGRRDLDEYAGRDERKGSRRDRGFEDEEDDDYSVRYSKKEAKAEKEAKEAEKKARRAAERAAKQAEQKGQIKLPEFISVQNLAQALGVRYEQFVNRLEDLGYDDVFPGKVFNSEVSGMIAMEYDLEPVIDTTARDDEEFDLKARPEVAAEDKEMLPTRPPVVTIMGHVDHGKTTILDYLRKSSVVAGEAGGITQHIGAFSVPLSASGKTITFLDTPGHAAFLAMRQRGANVTDIVILVIAADDSVKPQTLEAIKHARGAGVPMLVAVNKVDKESADVQRVKQDLARHGVEIEDFGGDTQVVEVSGKTGKGMDELEEATVTLSEILDHRADTKGAVEGWVIEATTKKSGRVATVLVRRGTLRQGAVIVAGNTWARVRTLHNEAGVAIDEAGPGMPVEVDGWREQPVAGDEVLQAPTEQKATSVVDYRLVKAEREKTAEDMEVINEARRVERERREREKAAAEQAKLRAKGEDGEFAEETSPAEESTNASGIVEVPFIIKADVSGSAEAVEAYVMSISSPMVMPRILYAAVGQIHESDVELAATTKGHIIAFNLPSNEGMKGMATSNGVKVLENNIIYRVIDDVKSVLEEKLPPIITQRVVGEAEVAMPFEISLGGRKKMKIAGCKVRNGLIGFGSRVRVMRGEEKIYEGTISSLKNVKKDVQEMRKGTECGMGFDGWEGFEAGDTIQTYEEKSEKRTL